MPINDFHKNIALITGAAGSIGVAIVRKLAPYMKALILVDIAKEKLKKIEKELVGQSEIQLMACYCNVGESKAVERMLEKVSAKPGLPSILINSAGMGGPFHRLDQVSDKEWYEIFETNLKSIFNLSRYLLPTMKQNKFGRIINIASVQGYLGASLSSTYVASKHGVIGYTKAIAAEWGQYGVTCNAICPGYVDTRMGIQNVNIENHYQKVIAKTPSRRIAQPEEIASLASYLLQDEASFINGAVLTIDGGLTCHVGVS